jgi:hypothetical protein
VLEVSRVQNGCIDTTSRSEIPEVSVFLWYRYGKKARIDTEWFRACFLQIFWISTTTPTTTKVGTISHQINTFTHKEGKEIPTSSQGAKPNGFERALAPKA